MALSRVHASDMLAPAVARAQLPDPPVINGPTFSLCNVPPDGKLHDLKIVIEGAEQVLHWHDSAGNAVGPIAIKNTGGTCQIGFRDAHGDFRQLPDSAFTVKQGSRWISVEDISAITTNARLDWLYGATKKRLNQLSYAPFFVYHGLKRVQTTKPLTVGRAALDWCSGAAARAVSDRNEAAKRYFGRAPTFNGEAVGLLPLPAVSTSRSPSPASNRSVHRLA